MEAKHLEYITKRSNEIHIEVMKVLLKEVNNAVEAPAEDETQRINNCAQSHTAITLGLEDAIANYVDRFVHPSERGRNVILMCLNILERLNEDPRKVGPVGFTTVQIDEAADLEGLVQLIKEQAGEKWKSTASVTTGQS